MLLGGVVMLSVDLATWHIDGCFHGYLTLCDYPAGSEVWWLTDKLTFQCKQSHEDHIRCDGLECEHR